MNFDKKPVVEPPKPKENLTTQERIKRAQAVNLAVTELSNSKNSWDELVLEARYDFYKAFLDKVLGE
jgi:hypothetical protein